MHFFLFEDCTWRQLTYVVPINTNNKRQHLFFQNQSFSDVGKGCSYVFANCTSHLFLICNNILSLKVEGSGYFVSRGKIAPCYFAIWRQNSPNGYFATSTKITLTLILTQILTQTLTRILTLIPTLSLTPTQTLTQTQTEEKHYFASRGKIATSKVEILLCQLRACLNNNGNLRLSRMVYVKKTRFLRPLLHHQIK